MISGGHTTAVIYGSVPHFFKNFIWGGGVGAHIHSLSLYPMIDSEIDGKRDIFRFKFLKLRISI